MDKHRKKVSDVTTELINATSIGRSIFKLGLRHKSRRYLQRPQSLPGAWPGIHRPISKRAQRRQRCEGLVVCFVSPEKPRLVKVTPNGESRAIITRISSLKEDQQIPLVTRSIARGQEGYAKVRSSTLHCQEARPQAGSSSY